MVSCFTDAVFYFSTWDEIQPTTNHRSQCPFGIARIMYHARTHIDEYIFTLSRIPLAFTFRRFLFQSLQ